MHRWLLLLEAGRLCGLAEQFLAFAIDGLFGNGGLRKVGFEVYSGGWVRREALSEGLYEGREAFARFREILFYGLKFIWGDHLL